MSDSPQGERDGKERWEVAWRFARRAFSNVWDAARRSANDAISNRWEQAKQNPGKTARALALFGAAGLAIAFAAWLLWTTLAIGLEALGVMSPTKATAGNDLRNLAFFIAAVIGAPFVVWRSYVAHWQARTAEQGLVTSRITQAVEQLGATRTVKVRRRLVRVETIDYGTERVRHVHEYEGEPLAVPEIKSYCVQPDEDRGEFIEAEEQRPNIEVRLGGLYALERIAQDSERDHIPIMEILCAYIRENAPASAAWELGLEEGSPLPDEASDEDKAAHAKLRKERFEPPREFSISRERAVVLQTAKKRAVALESPRADVTVALSIIGRRKVERYEIEKKVGYRVDLRQTCLQRVNMNNSLLDHALLNNTRMEGASFVNAQLRTTDLNNTRLEGADFSRALMSEAKLFRTRLEAAVLNEVNLERADLSEARMERAYCWMAQMQGAVLSRARMEGAVFWRAQMQGADLSNAQLEHAELAEAQMAGTDLRGAILKSADASACFTAAIADSADFSEAKYLTQDRLAHVLADQFITLPYDSETGEQLYVWSCWPSSPPQEAQHHRHRIEHSGGDFDAFLTQNTCPAGQPPCPVGRLHDEPR